ncbi:MAG: pyridoxamine 5'-phosphate oxidase family protein [Candidatus Dormibacteria bacterium]
MRRVDVTDIPELAALDRFLQWDLATVNPWGVPSVAAAGSRLLLERGEIWTSTTVGFQAKVRNIRVNPRVALLRHCLGEPAVLLRGEAEVVEGDGTDNLVALFRLMGDRDGARPRFYESATNPGWRRLYQEYWRRILIRVRIVEIGIFNPHGLSQYRIADWAAPNASRARRGPSPPPGADSGLGPLDPRGRHMIQDGVPVIMAVAEGPMSAPLIVPVRARQDGRGRIFVHEQPALPGRAFQRASLVVRVLDDTYELARMVAWIGDLAAGIGWREFRPRSAYGFAKPPGWIPDMAAGLAANLAARRQPASRRVSPPELLPAATEAGLRRSAPLHLPDGTWRALEDLFSSCNAIIPWYATQAILTRDRHLRADLNYLANRADLERDWAQSLLIRGGRRVSAPTLARGVVAMAPRASDPRTEALRRDRLLERTRQILRRELPEPLRPAVLTRLRSGPSTAAPISRDLAILEVARSAMGSAAAALDRLVSRG